MTCLKSLFLLVYFAYRLVHILFIALAFCFKGSKLRQKMRIKKCVNKCVLAIQMDDFGSLGGQDWF